MGERSRWLGLQLAELEVSDRGRHEAGGDLTGG